MKKRTLALLLAVTCLLGVTMTACPAPAPAPDGGSSTTTTDNGGGGGLPPTDTVSFSGDFTVTGADAAVLTAALTKNGISVGQTGALKTIYVNAAEGTLAIAALAKLNERTLNYADYVILTDETGIAIAAASAAATEAAIASLISNYKAEGALKMPKDLSLHYKPALSATTVSGTPLAEYTITYYDDAIAPIAEQLAEQLAPIVGKRLPVEKDAEARNLLILDAADTAATAVSRNLAIESYTLNVAATYASISADNPVLLSYAISAFAGTAKAGTALTAASSGEQAITLSTVKATDASLFKYTGIWQANMPDKHPDTMISYWNVNAVEIDFYGPAVTLLFPEATTCQYSIDGGAYRELGNARGSVTFYAGESGRHTLRIYSNDKHQHLIKHMYFGGAVIEENMTLTRTADRAHYIQFVGDSIVASPYSYPFTADTALGWDVAASARGGLPLTLPDNNPSYFTNQGLPYGMEHAFFQTGMHEDLTHLYTAGDIQQNSHLENYQWGDHAIDFSQIGNNPDIVFIAIGINDHLSQRPHFAYDYTEKFIEHYVAFVEKIYDTYGAETDVVIMSALNKATTGDNISIFTEAIEEIADALSETYGDRIHLLGYDVTSTWTDIDCSNDGVHPNVPDGYAALREHIYDWLLAEFPN